MAEKVRELNPDSIFWTGDIVPHDLWKQTLEHTIRYADWFHDFVESELAGYPVFPIDGNHDFGEIFNSQSFKQTDPMIAYFAASWKDWFDEEAHASFSKHGYYIAPFKTRDGNESDRVKVIGLNTQACYTMNFYLMSERNDPGGHLAWLDTELSLMQ